MLLISIVTKKIKKDYAKQYSPFDIADTELDSHALMYYIDIGRHDFADAEEYVNEFKKVQFPETNYKTAKAEYLD